MDIIKLHHKGSLILALFIAFFAIKSVSASTYSSNTNLFEGTYSNNLIDMAKTQVDNFIDKKFIIIQYDQNYYLVTADEFVVDGNTITFINSTIFSAVRYSSGYNIYYEYSSFKEANTIVYANNICISNLDFPRAVSSSRFEKYQTDSYTIRVLMFLLGGVFAIFLTKERRNL